MLAITLRHRPTSATSRESKRRTGVAQIILLLCTLAWLVRPAFGQAPQISPAGVVNAASYAQPIAPGSVVIPPTSVPGGSAIYSESLPSGFIAAGAYNIADGGSPAVGAFAGQFTVSPIQIQTDLSPGTVLDTTQPFTLTWTGGTAGNQVTVKLVNGTSSVGSYDYAYADASAGQLTFDPICIGTPVQAGGSGVFCGFSLPGINEVIVEISPGPNNVTSLSAPGITEGIQISWTYRYLFGSINPGP